VPAPEGGHEGSPLHIEMIPWDDGQVGCANSQSRSGLSVDRGEQWQSSGQVGFYQSTVWPARFGTGITKTNKAHEGGTPCEPDWSLVSFPALLSQEYILGGYISRYVVISYT